MAGGDSVDGTALRFLVKKALDRQKEEEEQAKVKWQEEEEKEERRMQRINAKVSNDIPLTREEHEAWKRWILAYASSSSSSAGKRRMRKKRKKRRLPRTSSHSLPGRACCRQRQWYASNAGCTGCDAPRVMFPSVDARPRMLCILAGMHQEDSYAVFAGDDAPRAVPARFHRCSSWTIYWPVECNDRFSGPGGSSWTSVDMPVAVLDR